MKKGKRQKQSLKSSEAAAGEPEQEARHHHHHPESTDAQKAIRLLTRIAEATEFIAKDTGRFFPSPEPVDDGPIPPAPAPPASE